MICLPIAKSNWTEGRVGPKTWQDSYRIQKTAVNLTLSGKVKKVLLLSEFKAKDVEKVELDCMIDTCISEGLSLDKMHIKSFGYDTLSTVKFSINFCEEQKADLIILSSIFHCPRIMWIAWRLNKNNINIKHKVALGIPRPLEMFSDIALVFLYPIIDLLGYSEWFTKHVKTRRDKGIL